MGHTYPIKRIVSPHINGAPVWGSFDSTEEEIVLQKKFKSRVKEADTFLHEIIHAVNHNTNLMGMVKHEDKWSLEEHITQTIANGLTTVFKDNPEVLDYLKDRLHGDDTTKKPQPTVVG